MRLRPLAVALAAAAGLGAAPPAHAIDADRLRTRLTAEALSAGFASGAFARDLDTGAELVSVRADAQRIPASVEKLFVGATAFLRFGPRERLETTVRAVAVPDEDGVLDGHVWLVGGGDPELDESDLERLARSVAAAGVTRVEGSVIGDDRLFDRRRGGPRTGWRPDGDLGGRLGALLLRRGFQDDPTRYAAGRFAALLRAEGVRVTGRTRKGRAPADAADVAATRSATMRTLVRHMLVPSDNFIAEMLLKRLGASFGSGGTTPAGAAVVRRSMADFEVRPRIADGSGLSRANATTPRHVVRLLEGMHELALGPGFARTMAVTGRTGTVSSRMRRGAARGRCRVKTGTIIGVSNLAGICRTRSGRRVAFAWLMNGVNPFGARRIQDRMTAAVARYSG